MTKRNKEKFTGTTLTLGAFYARTEVAPSDPSNSQAITNIPSNEASPSDPNNSQATTNISSTGASSSDPKNSEATTNIPSTEASPSDPSNTQAITNIPQLLQAQGEECSPEAGTKKTEAGLEKNAELSTETHSMDSHGQNQKAQQSASFTLPLYSDECAGKYAMPNSLIPSTEASLPNTSSSKAITDTNIPSTEANIASAEAIARPSQSPSPRDHCTSSGGAHFEETMTQRNKEKLTGIALSLGGFHASTVASPSPLCPIPRTARPPPTSQAPKPVLMIPATARPSPASPAPMPLRPIPPTPRPSLTSQAPMPLRSIPRTARPPPTSQALKPLHPIPPTARPLLTSQALKPLRLSPSNSQAITNILSTEASPFNPSKSQAITNTKSESEPQCCCLRCSTEADELNSDDKISVSDYILACQNQGPRPRLPLAQAKAGTKKTDEPLTSNYLVHSHMQELSPLRPPLVSELYAGEYMIPESFTSFLRSENSFLCPWAWDGGASASASATPSSVLDYQRDAKARTKTEDGDKSG